MLRVDVHQHLWTEPLLEALGRRSTPPFVRRNGHVWELAVPGEAVCTIDVAGDDAATRGALVHLDRLDRALLSLSTLLGVEALPGEEAQEVIDAYNDGLDGLPDVFGGWGALPLRDANLRDVDALLDRGYAGICIPAGALATPSRLDRIGPLLEHIERRGAPIFVHPGPDPFEAIAPTSDTTSWFPALTTYVASMNAAWHTFIAVGRKRLPHLRVLFAMLAGGAPLHLERLSARGGPATRAYDRNLFYDTSSYGEKAIDAIVRVVGIDQLVYGSDRPVVAPPAAPGPLGAAAWEAMTRSNPGRLFTTQRVAVAA